MLGSIKLSLLIGPVPVPAPRAVVDALSCGEGRAGLGRHAERLRADLRPAAALAAAHAVPARAAAAGGVPLMRVVLVVTINGRAESLIDGVATNVETQPGDGGVGEAGRQGQGPDRADGRHRDARRLPFPAMPPSVRVLLILAKYAAFGVIPMVIPSIVDEPPLPTAADPAAAGHRLRLHQEARAAMRATCSTSSPGPAPGTSQGLLGPGDPRRRAAARAVHRHGRADQRRGAVVQLRQEAKKHPDRLLPGAASARRRSAFRFPTSRR